MDAKKMEEIIGCLPIVANAPSDAVLLDTGYMAGMYRTLYGKDVGPIGMQFFRDAGVMGGEKALEKALREAGGGNKPPTAPTLGKGNY